MTNARPWWRTVLVALAWMLATAASAAEPGRLSLDTATAAELAALPDVGETLAARIVALREARGGLGSVEALRVLPGVSEEALMSLRRGTSLKIALSMAPPTTFASPADVLKQFDGEPDVRTVQVWAQDYAKLEPESVTKMIRASRAFGALPRVKAYYRVADQWDNDFRRFDELGNPPTSNNGTFFDVQTDASVGQDQWIYVEATWYLFDIVMSSEQLRAIKTGQDVAKLREKVLTEVTRIYYERRRLQVDMLLNPKPDLIGQVRDELRLRELGANLDAYTGGRFSESLTK